MCNQQSLSTWHTKCCTRKLERKRLMPSDGGSPSHHMLRNGSCYGVVECGPMAGACKLVSARRRSCAQTFSRASTRAASTALGARGPCRPPLFPEATQEHMAVLLHNIVKHGIPFNASIAKFLCEGVLRDDGLPLKETPDNVEYDLFNASLCQSCCFFFFFSRFFPSFSFF